MRYREGDPRLEPGGELPHHPFSEETFVGTVIYCLLLGIGGFVAGWYAKKLWVMLWSASLVIVSIVYLAYVFIFKGP